ncbi:MAG: M24 family metallopeptidase [Nitrospinota bacterium]
MAEELYPRFSREEMARRHGLARRLMEEEGLSALLLFGLGGTNRRGQADLYYLSGYRDFNHAYLILPREGEPTLFVGLYNHLHNARALSVFPDVRHGGYGPPQAVAERLEELGLGASRIGLVGVNPRFRIILPYDHLVYLRERFPEAGWVDVSARFRALRLVKSEEEIAWLQEGARLSDLALEALVEVARPGISEFELAGRMAAAYLARGGEQLVHMVTATSMADPRTPLPWQNATRRRVEAGDVILTELSAAYCGYAGQVLRPFTVGAGPTAEYRALFEVALETYEAMARAMRAGASAGEVLEAAEIIPRRGYRIYDSLAHGFGVDLLQPSLGIPGSAYAPPPADFRYGENMVMVIQPNPITADGRRGVQLGDLGVVTREGFRSLHTFPRAFLRCG